MADETVKDEQPKKESQSLKDFIEETQKMIAVIGVFFALAVLWKTLDPKGDPNVPFLCLLITIPLFVEIRRQLKPNLSWQLVMFNFSFMGIFLATAFYLIEKHWTEIGFQLWWSVCFIAAIFLWEVAGLAARRICHCRYLAINRWRELELVKNPDDAIFSQKMKQKNEALALFYKIIGAIRVVVFICIVLVLFSIYLRGDQLRHFAYDVLVGAPIITDGISVQEGP